MRASFFSVLFLFGSGLASAENARADNWARFRGPNGMGETHDKNIPVTFNDKQNVIWKLAIPGQGNSSPIVWGKYLFLQTAPNDGSQRLLVCIDAGQGKELWSRGISASKSPTHTKNTLASGTAATDGESVFVSFWDGKDTFLAAYNFKGDLLWNRPLGHWVSQHGAGASPILFRDKVIFYNDMDKEEQKTKRPVAKPATLYALSKKTGDIIWEMPREAYRACYSAPFILETPGAAPELIVTSTTSITSYNPDDGSQNWRWNWKFKGMQLRTISATHYVDGTLLACSGDGGGDRHMCAIALDGVGKDAHPHQIWENRKDFPYVPCLVTKGEHVYFVNDAGFVGCYEFKTGKRIWFERLPGATFTASPVLIDGKVYASSEEGDVYVFAASPKSLDLISKNFLGERIRATPAVADGRLYIRGQNHLYCIGTK
jgi:outer membrane protein assembly factor BamB